MSDERPYSERPAARPAPAPKVDPPAAPEPKTVTGAVAATILLGAGVLLGLLAFVIASL